MSRLYSPLPSTPTITRPPETLAKNRERTLEWAITSREGESERACPIP